MPEVGERVRDRSSAVSRRPSCSARTGGGRRWCSAARGCRRTSCCGRARCGRSSRATSSRKVSRHSDYAYRLAVESPAAKEIRMFGLAGWAVDRYAALRRTVADALYKQRRLKQRPLGWTVGAVLVGNVVVFWSLAMDARAGNAAARAARRLRAGRGRLQRPRVQRVRLVVPRERRADPARARPRRRAASGRERSTSARAAGRDAGRARSASSTCRSRTRRRAWRCWTASTSRSRPARRSRSSARTAPGRRRSRSSCAACTTRRTARYVRTASTSVSSTSRAWRSRVAAVFQDFVRYELSLRENVAPLGADDDVVRDALHLCARGGPRRARPRAVEAVRGRDRSVRRPVAARRAGARRARPCSSAPAW